MNKKPLKNYEYLSCRIDRKAMEQLDEIPMDVGLIKTKIIEQAIGRYYKEYKNTGKGVIMMSYDWDEVFKHKGIQKLWIYQSAVQYNLAHAYLEKAKNVIHDFRPLRKQLKTRKQVVYAIILMTWMWEAVENYQKTLLLTIYDNFTYTQEDLWIQAKKYQKAIRSFIVAHPLSTNQHKQFSFDGDRICIDIVPGYQQTPLFKFIQGRTDSDIIQHISFDGITDVYYEDDCLVQYYSVSADQAQYHHLLGFSIKDIAKTIDLCVDRLFEIDLYLSKLKKKDYI